MRNVNCLRCRFRHEDNGNCTAVGGFCTAVAAAHCPLLREYLDTGLMPEEVERSKLEIEAGCFKAIARTYGIDINRLRKLAEADREGRVVVLPCKVGDTVYFRTYDCNGTVDLGIQPHKVTAIVWHAIVRGEYTDVGLLPGQYGVSWFLTREEADAALEAMEKREVE